jgi:Tfp pilus assembly protein PilX
MNMNMKMMAQSPKGFALIAALLAIMILAAVGMLVFSVSTQDIRISSRTVGEKKAFSAAEAGIHRFMQSFNPANLSASAVSNVQVDSSNDRFSRYIIGTPSRPTTGPSTVPLAGYAIGGGQQWGQDVYSVGVTGTNTQYNSIVQVNIGAGFGPIEISTAYR